MAELVIKLHAFLLCAGRDFGPARPVNMKPYAVKFYTSDAWENTRKAYSKSVGGLCEKCLGKGEIRAGVIVHHKTFLNPDNINDPNITLNWNNLQLLCRECHGNVHRGKKRWKVDEMGRVCD